MERLNEGEHTFDETMPLPTVDLAMWVGIDVEPCPRCGKYHKDRRKWVCDGCNKIVCAGCVRRVWSGVYHVVRYPYEDETSLCGEAGPTSDLWPLHRADLEHLLQDLEAGLEDNEVEREGPAGA